jgi:hypothetical protein
MEGLLDDLTVVHAHSLDISFHEYALHSYHIIYAQMETEKVSQDQTNHV